MLNCTDQEFNGVSREFCDGFEYPEVRTAKDIVKFNEENAELAMPELTSIDLPFDAKTHDLQHISTRKNSLLVLKAHLLKSNAIKHVPRSDDLQEKMEWPNT